MCGMRDLIVIAILGFLTVWLVWDICDPGGDL